MAWHEDSDETAAPWLCLATPNTNLTDADGSLEWCEELLVWEPEEPRSWAADAFARVAPFMCTGCVSAGGADSAGFTDHDSGNSSCGDSDSDGPPPPQAARPVCKNCATTKTTLWRRNKTDDLLCNACALYWKLHKRARPLALMRNVIRRRGRNRR